MGIIAGVHLFQVTGSTGPEFYDESMVKLSGTFTNWPIQRSKVTV